MGEMDVSIIMPCYNAEATLSESIQSVLAQTHTAYELILIDDGSTDATRSIMEDYCSRDPRIRVLFNDKNRGVSYTRNYGVSQAKYDWIALLDGDDLWTPDKLDKQIALIEQHPDCVLFFTGSAFINVHGEKSGYIFHARNRITNQDLMYQNLIPCSSVMVRRDVMLKYPMDETYAVGEDYLTWLQILKDYGYAIGLDEPMLTYRVGSRNLPRSKFRSARIQWRTYRKYIHLSLPKSCYYFAHYAARNLKKYLNIHYAKAAAPKIPEQTRGDYVNEESKTAT